MQAAAQTQKSAPRPSRDWRVKDQAGCLLIVDGDDYQVCSVGSKDIHGVPEDAALIAAAPKLLEALTAVFCALGIRGANADIKHQDRKLWERCRAATKEAEGAK